MGLLFAVIFNQAKARS